MFWLNLFQQEAMEREKEEARKREEIGWRERKGKKEAWRGDEKEGRVEKEDEEDGRGQEEASAVEPLSGWIQVASGTFRSYGESLSLFYVL